MCVLYVLCVNVYYYILTCVIYMASLVGSFWPNSAEPTDLTSTMVLTMAVCLISKSLKCHGASKEDL